MSDGPSNAPIRIAPISRVAARMVRGTMSRSSHPQTSFWSDSTSRISEISSMSRIMMLGLSVALDTVSNECLLSSDLAWNVSSESTRTHPASWLRLLCPPRSFLQHQGKSPLDPLGSRYQRGPEAYSLSVGLSRVRARLGSI